jgi:hypothetical protein
MVLTDCIGGRCARACSSSGISMGLNSEQFLQAELGNIEDKVMAGGTPANTAAMASP